MKEMKKAGLFAVGILLISLFAFVTYASAQEAAPGLNPGEVPLVNEVQQGQQVYTQYTTAENKTAYLTQQWATLLGKAQYIGPTVTAIDSALKFLNPFFKIVLGYDYGLSWAFVFALLIWFILFFFFSPIASQIFNSKIIGPIVSFVAASLIGFSGAIKMVIEMLALFLTNNWVFWIVLSIAIILAFVSGKLGRMIKKKIKVYKEKSMEEQRAQSTEVIKAQAEVSRKGLEELSK